MDDATRIDTDLALMDACALSDAIRARKVSCVEVMTAFLDRIERLNPKVNAIVSLQDRSRSLGEARERDDELARGEHRGWMHGFPQAIKDLAPAAGFPLTKGSPLFGEVSKEDGIFVARMRRAGAIVIGKTNTPEFGLGSQTYNPVFGPTLNAYDQAKTAGGSSGGAAVALALRMLPVADGSDHGGSLRNPAAFNNLFGFRPSYGRVPANAEEVFLPQLSVMAGYDARLPFSIDEDPAVFAEPLKRDVKGLRLAWFGDLGGHLPMEPGILDLCRAALKVFEDMGCIVEEVAPDFDPERIWQAWLPLRHWQTGAPLLEFFRDPEKRARMKPEAQWEIEEGLKLSAYDIAKASGVRSAWYQTVRRLFERYDYWLLPSAQVFPFDVSTPWPKEIAGRRMDTYHRWMGVVIPATMSGCPAISVPVGFGGNGLPMGMQIVGQNRGELAVLQLAHAYDEATGWVRRKPPTLT